MSIPCGTEFSAQKEGNVCALQESKAVSVIVSPRFPKEEHKEKRQIEEVKMRGYKSPPVFPQQQKPGWYIDMTNVSLI